MREHCHHYSVTLCIFTLQPSEPLYNAGRQWFEVENVTMTEFVVAFVFTFAVVMIANRLLTRARVFENLAGGYMQSLEDQNWQFISGENGRGDTRFV